MKRHIFDRMIEAGDMPDAWIAESMQRLPESLIDISDVTRMLDAVTVPTEYDLTSAADLRPPFPLTMLWFRQQSGGEWLVAVRDMTEDDAETDTPWVAHSYCTWDDPSAPYGYDRVRADFWASRTHGMKVTRGPGLSQSESDEEVEVARSLSVPIVLALQFLNCVNVTTETVPPPPPKERRRRARRGLPHYLAYQRLIIPGVSQRGGGSGGGETPPPALHVVRGHFKHYTPENPLFGRLTGTYWWHPHARGTETSGVVRKTYKVGAPATPGTN